MHIAVGPVTKTSRSLASQLKALIVNGADVPLQDRPKKVSPAAPGEYLPVKFRPRGEYLP